MTARVAPITGKDRQVNRFNDDVIKAVDYLDRRITDRFRIVRWADFLGEGPGANGDVRIVDEVDGGGEWVHDGDVWRPFTAGTLCRRPPPAAQWTTANPPAAGAGANLSDRYGELHIAGACAIGRSPCYVAMTVASSAQWRVEAGFRGIIGNDVVADQNSGFGVFACQSDGARFVCCEFNAITSTGNFYPRYLGGYGAALSASVVFSGGSATRTAHSTGPATFLRIDKTETAGGTVFFARGGPDKQMRFSAGLSVAYGTAFASTPTLCGIYIFSSTTNIGPHAECFHFDQVAL